MPERGFIRYSDPLDTVLGHLEKVEQDGGYCLLTPVAGDGEEEIKLTSMVDVIEALAEGRLARDGLYRVEYVAELVEEA